MLRIDGESGGDTPLDGVWGAQLGGYWGVSPPRGAGGGALELTAPFIITWGYALAIYRRLRPTARLVGGWPPHLTPQSARAALTRYEQLGVPLVAI